MCRWCSCRSARGDSREYGWASGASRPSQQCGSPLSPLGAGPDQRAGAFGVAAGLGLTGQAGEERPGGGAEIAPAIRRSLEIGRIAEQRAGAEHSKTILVAVV